MPSTYSTNLKLTLMATGENSGTWGDETNNNLGTLLEQAIVGYDTISMADADQSVDILDGQTSKGRCLALRCNGSLTATRTLTVPTVYKSYLITNATTGGQIITVKTAAGTGVDVGAGTRKMVYVDGTNVVDAFTAATNFTVTGTLTTSGTTTVDDLVVVDDVTVGGQINKLTITTPANGSTLTIADGKTLTASNSLTFTGTDSTSFAFPSTSGTVTTLAATQTLTNKTLTAPVISTISNTGTITLPTSTDTLVGRATTDTLTNKTLTSPTINSGAMGASSTATTQTAGDNSTKLATTAYVDTLRVSGARITNSLAANVSIASTGTYYTGPTIAQGSTGTWWVSGTVTVSNLSGGDVIDAKLWDGTNVIASSRVTMTSVGLAFYEAISLSGYISSPAGNLRISVSGVTRTDSFIAFNASGNSKDSTISAFRIA